MDNLFEMKDDSLQIDETKDWHAELVGEGRKYADDKALALSRVHADRHISFVEGENAELRSELLKLHEQATAGAKLQELSDKIEAQLQQLASREPTLESKEVNKQPTIDEQMLDSLLGRKIETYEQSKLERENYNQVTSKLKEKFGNSFAKVLQEKARALKMSDEEVNAMARRNPDLFRKTFDLDQTTSVENFQTPPKNSSNFSPKAPQQRTWSYYLDLKKKDPNAWLDKNIAIQMEKDSQALGEKFFDV